MPELPHGEHPRRAGESRPGAGGTPDRAAAGRRKADTAWMTGSTLLLGVSGFAFLALVGHGRFDPTTFAALSSLYLLTNILGPGLFIAVEHETSRRTTLAVGAHTDPTPVIRRLAVVTAALVSITVIVLVAAAPALVPAVFGDRAGLDLALALSVVGSGAVFLLRGVLGGRRRFRPYATTVMVDGGVRLVGCAVLALAGSHDAMHYALALCVAPLVSGATLGRSARDPERRAPMPFVPGYLELSGSVGGLLVAGLLSMTLANLAPVLVTAGLPAEPAVAAGFATGLILTRVPLLLTGPLQALLLPEMTRVVASGEGGGLLRRARRALLVLGVTACLGAAGAWVVGPWVVAVLFGASNAVVSGAALAVLTLSAFLFIAIQLCQPALVALGAHRWLAWGWVVGAVVWTALFLLPLPIVDRALLAQIVAPAMTLSVHLLGAARSSRGARPSA